MLKEALFNMLESSLVWESCHVLDLFAGTGNLGMECISRGASGLQSVDHSISNIRYMSNIQKKLAISEWKIWKQDAIEFCKTNRESFNLILADPPYDFPGIHDLVRLVCESEWFNRSESIFILEHSDRLVFKHNQVFLNKHYGNSAITGFKSKSNP